MADKLVEQQQANIEKINKLADAELTSMEESKIQADEIHDAQLAKGNDSNLFTRREWIMRYASPFKALMFMAGPMVIIMLVNSLYGIIDKQLALNYAIDNVKTMFQQGGPMGYITGTMMWHGASITLTNTSPDEAITLFAKHLINVSTQYSNTIITLLSAMSLLTSVGTAIKWGQAMGERDKQRMDSIITMGLIQTLIMGGIGILVLHFVGPYIIISQADTPYSQHEASLIFALSNEYTQMFIWGFPLLAFATFISTMIRTEGKVWWVIIINISAIVLNIGCGEAFMEAAPAAQKMQSAVYGSFIAWSWMIVVGLLVIATSKNTLLRPSPKNIKLKLKDAGTIWLYGISPFVSNFIFAVANYVTTLLITIAHPGPDLTNSIVVQWWTNGGVEKGDPFYISQSLQAMSASFPWMNILYAPLLGMMQGANANYAYCKGAGKRFRMIQMWRIHILINMTWGVLVLIIIAAAGGPMMAAFDGPSDLKWWFFAYICGIIFAGMTYSAISLFQGTGDAFNATMVAVLRSLVCNVGFVVIGWAIAKNISTDGHNDWVIFLLNGLCEIPATIVGMYIVYKYFKKLIKEYKVNDVVDDFDSPSLLQAAKNELIIAQQSLDRRANRIYARKLRKVYQNHGYGSQEELDTEQWLKDQLGTIEYNTRQKDIFVESKFKFKNQSYGRGGRDRLYKQLIEWKEKQDWLILTSGSLTPEQDQIKINSIYLRKYDAITQKINKQNEYAKKLEDGEIKLTPIKLLFVQLAPQPLKATPEVKTQAEAKAKKIKKNRKIRLKKKGKVV